MGAGSQYRMVIDDPSKFHLLADDMKALIIKGAAQTANIQAALTRKNAIQNIKNDFTLRNKFTAGGANLHFDRADENAKSFDEVSATFGAVRQYMERQEEGGKHKDTKGKQLAIPTTVTRNGSNANPVPRNMYIKNVRKKMFVYNPTYGKGTGKSNLVSAAESAFKRNAFLMYNKNIFRVKDFKKSDDKVKFTLEMVYFRELSETDTPAKPWLEPAMKKPIADRDKIFISQMNKLDK